MKRMTVKLTFTEEMLGTKPADPEIYSTYVSPKEDEKKDEELAALPEMEQDDKGVTVFARDENGEPAIWDYQIKGFFKDACSMLRRVDGTLSKKMTAYKKIIDGLVFVKPRLIPITVSGEMGFCERPLRAQTMQGERVSLAKSETVPAGSTIEFTVFCLKNNDMGIVKELLDYGELRGLGQWRNSGKGTFTYEIIEEKTVGLSD